jgi:hypothetical protein
MTVLEWVAVAAVVFLAYGLRRTASLLGRSRMPEQDLQVMVATPTEPRCYVLGRTVKSGVRAWSQSKDGYLYFVVVLASHEVQAIGDIFFNDELVGTLDANGDVTTGRFSGHARIRKYLGTTSQAADADLMAAFPTQWTSEHRLLGLAYITVRLKRNDEIYTQGAPTPRAEIFGMKVKDPRDGVIRYTDNAALLLRWYLIADRGAAETEVDDTSWIAAANVCDEWVALGLAALTVASVDTSANTLTLTKATNVLEDGMRCQVTAAGLPAPLAALTNYYVIVVDKTTFRLATTRQNAIQHTAIDLTTAGSGVAIGTLYQARYTVNGVFDAETEPRDVVTRIGASMGNTNGCIPTQGIYKCYPGAYVAPSRTLTISDLRGSIAMTPRATSRDAFNEIHGTFMDPLADWQSRDYPPVKNATYVANDYGVVSPTNIDFPYCTNEIRAQRLAKIELERHRQSITVSWPGKISLFGVAPGDRVGVTVAALGWSSKTFRVETWSLSEDFGVDLQLAEEASAIYDWAGGEATLTDPAPDTNFPKPWQIDAPTSLACDSGTAHLLLGGDGTVLSRILVTWAYVGSAHATGFELRWKRSAESQYETMRFPLDARGTYITGVQDGTGYDVSVRALSLASVSSWITISHTVVGKSAPPSVPSGFAASLVSTGVRLTWTGIADADADLYAIRQGGANWGAATPVQTVRGTTVQLPFQTAGAITWRIKAIDTTGNESTTDATASLTISAPSTVAPAGAVQGTDYRLTWAAATASHPVSRYEIRHGASFGAGTFVASVDVTTFKAAVDWTGTRTFWVAAIDEGNNVGTAGSVAITVNSPEAPSPSLSYVGPDAVLIWSPPIVAPLPVVEYELRYGASYAAGTSIGRLKGTTQSFRVNWTGSRTYWVAAIDSAGTVSTAGSVVVNPTVPGAVSITPAIANNITQLSWTSGAGSLPIERYEMRKGATWAGATSLGYVSDARLKTLVEVIGGSYTYWVTGTDTAGNVGTPASVTVTVSNPPNLTVYESINSTFAGTLSNASLVSGPTRVLFPHDTTKTWHQKFVDGGWATVAAKGAAGYTMWVEPTTASGYYEETVDHGSSIASVNVGVSVTTTTLHNSPVISCIISYKVLVGDAWTDVAGFTATGITGRYFKVRITCTATGSDDLATLDVLQWMVSSSSGGGGGATDLSYTASTRLLASSTGADVTLPLLSSTDAGLAPASGGGTTNFLRADGTWAAPGAGGITFTSTNLAFTDGDTFKRFTISDAGVSATSKIIGSIVRPSSASDSADRGYLYTFDVVNRGSGTFDLLVSAHDGAYGDCTDNPPNETVQFHYIVG